MRGHACVQQHVCMRKDVRTQAPCACAHGGSYMVQEIYVNWCGVLQEGGRENDGAALAACIQEGVRSIQAGLPGRAHGAGLKEDSKRRGGPTGRGGHDGLPTIGEAAKRVLHDQQPSATVGGSSAETSRRALGGRGRILHRLGLHAAGGCRTAPVIPYLDPRVAGGGIALL